MSGLDWSKINQTKQTLEERLAPRVSTSAKFWKPNSGDNKIRVLPGWATEGDFQGQFWREVYQHWMTNDEGKMSPVICPSKTPYVDGSCPICEFVDQLREMKSDLRAQELVKEYRAKAAFFLNIVDLKDPVYTAKDVAEFKQRSPEGDMPFEVGDPKVQVYAAPGSVFNMILGAIHTNGIDITDADTGNDIVVSKTGAGLYTKYSVQVIIKPSAAPADAEPVALENIGRILDESKLTEMLSAGSAGEFMAHLDSGSSLPALGVPKTAAKPKVAARGKSKLDDDDDDASLKQQLMDALGD